ncbi:MAG TPA: TolC family protein [Nitrospiraceae bacterium]|nr:TolC family protein [Nitrospiraceae bacterium]
MPEQGNTVLNGLNSPSERSRSLTSLLTTVLLILAIIDLSSCAIKPIPLTTDEVRARVKEGRSVLTNGQEPVSGPIDLYEAMARALKYNLDARVELMHKMLAQTQLDLSHYAMLPRLAANAGFDGRSNYSGGSVARLPEITPFFTPFTSSDKNVFSADLSLSWNVLDFGMSYIRAKQAADDVLIADEERRRVANRVMQDVRSAYWRAVSAERILPSLKVLDEWVKTALEKAQAVQDEKLSTPLVPLQYRLELLNTQRYIQQLFRELSTAKLQLAALINLPPGQEHEMRLMVPEREDGTLNLPSNMVVLEDRALEARPELRMIDYRRRINARETKAAILEMLPNLNLLAGGNYNSNSFLFYNNWYAYAARASWNLLSLVRYPARAKTIEAQDKVLHTQNLALTMAIMSQVHVSVAQVAQAKKETSTAKLYHDTQSQISEQTRLGWRIGRQSEQAVLRERVNQVSAQLRYDAMESELQVSWAMLLAAVGEDVLPNDLMREQSVSELALELRTRWAKSKELLK